MDTTDVGHCVVTITSRINWFLDLFCKHHSFTRPLAYFEIRIFLSQADQATSAPVFTCGLTFGLFFWKLKRIILSGPSSSQGRKAGAEGSKRQAKQRGSRLQEGQVQHALAAWRWPHWWQWAAGGCQQPHFGLFCWTNNSDVRVDCTRTCALYRYTGELG